jgi:hypothetical protein
MANHVSKWTLYRDSSGGGFRYGHGTSIRSLRLHVHSPSGKVETYYDTTSRHIMTAALTYPGAK